MSAGWAATAADEADDKDEADDEEKEDDIAEEAVSGIAVAPAACGNDDRAAELAVGEAGAANTYLDLILFFRSFCFEKN